jgi:hypothetical protein
MRLVRTSVVPASRLAANPARAVSGWDLRLPCSFMEEETEAWKMCR